MDTYRVVLFIHLLSLLLGVSAGGVIAACLLRLRAAGTVEQAAPWGMLAGQVEKLFPFAIVGLFATGAYMTSDVWTWSTQWIDVSIAGLVVIALEGPLVAGRRAHALKHALLENGPGELRGAARELTRDPLLWIASNGNLGIVLGIVWNMTEKPGAAGSVAAVVVGWAVAAALSLLATRPAGAPEAAPAGEVAG